jgi:ATP adenylyltransferase
MSERLWAPWRMSYLTGAEAPGGCLFCRVIEAPEASDRENLVLCRRPEAFVMLNRYPYAAGHLMVAPVGHVAAPDALPESARAALAELLAFTLSRLRDAVRPDGMNLGMNLGKVGGAGFADHCHWHLVPRFSGDTNFMPVVADTRVVPEALGATWERLRPFFS